MTSIKIINFNKNLYIYIYLYVYPLLIFISCKKKLALKTAATSSATGPLKSFQVSYFCRSKKEKNTFQADTCNCKLIILPLKIKNKWDGSKIKISIQENKSLIATLLWYKWISSLSRIGILRMGSGRPEHVCMSADLL